MGRASPEQLEQRALTARLRRAAIARKKGRTPGRNGRPPGYPDRRVAGAAPLEAAFSCGSEGDSCGEGHAGGEGEVEGDGGGNAEAEAGGDAGGEGGGEADADADGGGGGKAAIRYCTGSHPSTGTASRPSRASSPLNLR